MFTTRTRHTKPPIALGSTIWYCDTSDISVKSGYVIQAQEKQGVYSYQVRSSDGQIARVAANNIHSTKEAAQSKLKKRVIARINFDLDHAKRLQAWLQEQGA